MNGLTILTLMLSQRTTNRPVWRPTS